MITQNIPLLVTNVSYGLFFLITVGFGVSVYLRSSRKIAHVMFLLLSLAVGIFQICHVFGINVLDGEASRDILTGNLSVIFIVCFTIHWILAVLEKDSERWKTIVAFYTVAVGLLAFYIARPEAFLVTSVPKLYFPNYYEAGEYYWLMTIFFAVGGLYALSALIRAYRVADQVHRNRLRYFILAIVTGFPLGSTAFFLVMNIPIDPIYSTLFSAYIIPLAYGILRYDVMDIKVIAKKAFSYGVLVALIGIGVALVNWSDTLLHDIYPWLPGWAVPLTSSIIAVLVGGFVWEKMRDIDILKYEFITVVTHKFRTPLTRIKWASEMLKKSLPKEVGQETRLAIEEVDNANELLVELTDMLVGLRKSDDVNYLYAFEETDVCALVEKASKNMTKHMQDKNLSFRFVCESGVPTAMLDARRMQFALQIIIENAVVYTPSGGSVSVEVKTRGSHIAIEVRDTGIGISKDDLDRVFTKFFRSKEAKTTDTEGMGIGLFMARQIVDRHEGEIQVASAGVGQGTTFTVELPHA